MRLPFTLRSRRVPPEVTAAAQARIVAIAVQRPADSQAPGPEQEEQLYGDAAPVLVTDAPPWPTSARQQPFRPAEPMPPEPPGFGTATAGAQEAGATAEGRAHARGRHQSARRPLREAVANALPPVLRGGRLALDQPAAVALALVGLAGALLGGLHLWRARPAEAPLPPPAVVAAGTASPSASPSAGTVTVDVQGLVRRPGVVRLPPGSRVIDALQAAGGAVPGAATASLNLARVLADGEQVVVAAPGAAPTPAPGAVPTAGASPTSAMVDLNTADLGQLDELPGVGPVLAQRILDWRTEHGRFTSVDELREVDGIGDRRFADLKNRVRV
jgi:competence protein ComEA